MGRNHSPRQAVTWDGALVWNVKSPVIRGKTTALIMVPLFLLPVAVKRSAIRLVKWNKSIDVKGADVLAIRTRLPVDGETVERPNEPAAITVSKCQGRRCMTQVMGSLLSRDYNHCIVRCQQLNGNQGSATNSDDVKTRRNVRKKSAKKVKGSTTQPKVSRDGISECSMKYALAIASPFHLDAMGSCVPHFPSRPTFKTMGFVRSAQITIGSAGVGGAFFMPTVANDNVFMTTTKAGYSTADLYMSSSTSTDYSARLNLPYAGNELVGSDMAFRIVSAGVRVNYTGTELNRGGTMYGYVSSSHQPLTTTIGTTSNITAATLSALTTTIIKPVGEVLELSMFGIDDQEVRLTSARTDQDLLWPFQTQQIANAASVPVSDFGCPIAVVLVTGTPGNTFRVEYVQHVEYVGAASAAMQTPTHSDARGFEIVQEAASTLPLVIASTGKRAEPVMRDLIRRGIRELAPVGRALVRSAADYFLPGSGAVVSSLLR